MAGDLQTPISYRALGERIAEGDGWDSDATGDSAEIAIPAGAVFVDIYCTELTEIQLTKVATDPTETGAKYPGNAVYRFACKGCTYLHSKNGTAGTNTTISATAGMQSE